MGTSICSAICLTMDMKIVPIIEIVTFDRLTLFHLERFRTVPVHRHDLRDRVRVHDRGLAAVVPVAVVDVLEVVVVVAVEPELVVVVVGILVVVHEVVVDTAAAAAIVDIETL